MLENMYWPYDEVSMAFDSSKTHILVNTPWMNLQIELKPDALKMAEHIIQNQKSQSVDATDVKIMSAFIEKLKNFPLYYILAQPKLDATDIHQVKENSFSSSLELSQLKSTWDVDAAIQFSKINQQQHPECLLTIARRYHLLDMMESDKGRSVFAKIESLDKKEFAIEVSKLVKQNLYVTEKCQQALTPALQTAQSAKPILEAFIRDERGHDKLLLSAMTSIHEDYATIQVSQETIELMNLLKSAAESNFLAFCIAIDFFERSSYEEIDPLASLLLKGGFEEAARKINRHKEINDMGGHENMSLKLLGPMLPVDEVYAREAMRIAELISKVINKVSQSTSNI